MNFEDQLRDALRPVEPPPDLVNRILAATGSAPAPRRRFPVQAAAMWALAACLILGVGFIKQRIEGERARQQVLTALQITGMELSSAQQRLERHSRTITIPTTQTESR